MDRARNLARPAAIGSIVGAVALNALGILGDGTAGDDGNPLVGFLVVCGFIGVAAALVFGWVVPRGINKVATSGVSGVAGLVLSVLALVFVAVFWSGLPPVLAAGGIVLGLAGRDAHRGAGVANAAIVVGILALIADFSIYALDWLSTNGVL